MKAGFGARVLGEPAVGPQFPPAPDFSIHRGQMTLSCCQYGTALYVFMILEFKDRRDGFGLR